MGRTGKERKFPSSARLISTTDLEGKVTYANQEFCEVAGYSLEELVGKPHSLVRHPDMPPEAFADLWRYVNEDKAWMGIVKNLCSDGDYYWVQAYVTPLYDEAGVKIGYQSVRTRPSDEQIARAEKIYQKINANSRLKIRSRSASASMLAATVAGSLSALALLLLPVPLIYIALGQTLLFALMALIVWRNARSFKVLADMCDKIYPNKLAQYVMSPYMNEVGAAELSNLMMQARLRTVTGRVEDSVGTLTTFVDQTHIALEQTAQGVEKQNVETDMLASAATQMSATAHEIAENTSQTSKATQDAASLAREGKEIVEGMINGIRDLVSEVSLAGDSSNELKSKAAAVEQVIEIINEIAEQTNLLALNAAIEAARAGEQGRGFSVVADEVRVLAKRTRESTEEIRLTIEAIQQQVGSTVDAMQRCSSNAQENIQRAERVGSSFDQVNAAMLDITDRSTQVAAASEQQSAVADEVSRNIENIRQVSLQNSEIAHRTHRSAADLTGLVCDLKSMIKAI